MGVEVGAGLTGGCQCGAVRYRLTAEATGANICHCRMCQKAGGAPFMAFGGVRLDKLLWTRGAPKVFASSSIAERGFCAECGTPLTYRMLRARPHIGDGREFDRPAAVAPTIQFDIESKVAWLDDALASPAQDIGNFMKLDLAAVGSRQHPDHET